MRFKEYYTKVINEADDVKSEEDSLEQSKSTDQKPVEPKTPDVAKDAEKSENEEDKKKGEEKERKANLNSEDYKKARDELVKTFNEENEKQTRVRLQKHNVEEPKSIKVIMETDVEEIYLDKDKYKTGDVTIGLSEIFFNDVLAMAKEIGIYDIVWKKSGPLHYGILRLEKPVDVDTDTKEK